MKWLIHYNNNTCVYWNKELVVLFNSKWKGVLSSHMTSHCTAVHSWACFSTGYFRKVTRISIQSMEQDAWKTQYCSFTTFIKKSCKWRKTAGTTYCRISGDILLIFCRWNKQHLFLSNVGSLNSVQSIKQKIYRIVFNSQLIWLKHLKSAVYLSATFTSSVWHSGTHLSWMYSPSLWIWFSKEKLKWKFSTRSLWNT